MLSSAKKTQHFERGQRKKYSRAATNLLLRALRHSIFDENKNDYVVTDFRVEFSST